MIGVFGEYECEMTWIQTMDITSFISSPNILFILHVVDFGDGPAIAHVSIDMDWAGSILLLTVNNDKSRETLLICC